MDKKELLSELSAKMAAGEVSRDEIMALLQHGGGKGAKKLPSFSLTKMLYALGIAIVVVGIVIFVAQVWDDIGSVGRIVVTLGLGLLFAAIGSALFKQQQDKILGSVFHFIGGVLIPSGALVTLDELSTGANPEWALAVTFGIIFVFYLLLSLVHKNIVLSVFAILNGTAFVYLLVNAIVNSYVEGLYAYLTMVIGTSYFLIAHAFRDKWEVGLVGILYFFGAAGFLGAAFTRVFDSVPWQVVYFLIVFGWLFLSIYIKNTFVLIISVLALIVHVSYITNEYFADSLGWPICLVILGFVFLGLGYASFAVNKRYISSC